MHPALITAMAAASSSGRHFHIGPWIIVPILILAAIAGAIVFAVREHQKRQRPAASAMGEPPWRSGTDRRL